MIMFVAVMLIIMISDFFDLIKAKNKRGFLVYFILSGLVLTGAGFFYAAENTESLASLVLNLINK